MPLALFLNWDAPTLDWLRMVVNAAMICLFVIVTFRPRERERVTASPDRDLKQGWD